MRIQSWIKFIGIVCVVLGAFGIIISSGGLSYMPFSELKMELSSKVPLHIIKWRHSLRYLALFVNVIYFIAGIYFLLKKSFSLHLMYAALALSILQVIVPMIFLNPYSDNPTLYRYGFNFFNFVRPVIDMSLMAGVFMISKNYYPVKNGLSKKAGSKVKNRIPVAVISGVVINLLISNVSGLFTLDCLPYSLITGSVFLFAGLALGFFWPSFSWKTGLYLIASNFLGFLPLGILSSWFAHGWDFAFSKLMNCEIYFLVAILIASCLGSFLGSLLKHRIVG